MPKEQRPICGRCNDTAVTVVQIAHSPVKLCEKHLNEWYEADGCPACIPVEKKEEK